MEYTSDGCNRGTRGDGENGLPDGVDEEGGVGDGVLHLVDSLQHLRGDGILPRGGGQGVG